MKKLLFTCFFITLCGTLQIQASSEKKSEFKFDITPPKLESENYYHRLGLYPTGDFKKIKKAYRQCALLYHPDKHPEDDPEKHEELFKRLEQAYGVLKDPTKKNSYDLSHGFFENLDAPTEESNTSLAPMMRHYKKWIETMEFGSGFASESFLQRLYTHYYKNNPSNIHKDLVAILTFNGGMKHSFLRFIVQIIESKKIIGIDKEERIQEEEIKRQEICAGIDASLGINKLWILKNPYEIAFLARYNDAFRDKIMKKFMEDIGRVDQPITDIYDLNLLAKIINMLPQKQIKAFFSDGTYSNLLTFVLSLDQIDKILKRGDDGEELFNTLLENEMFRGIILVSFQQTINEWDDEDLVWKQEIIDKENLLALGATKRNAITLPFSQNHSARDQNNNVNHEHTFLEEKRKKLSLLANILETSKTFIGIEDYVVSRPLLFKKIILEYQLIQKMLNKSDFSEKVRYSYDIDKKNNRPWALIAFWHASIVDVKLESTDKTAIVESLIDSHIETFLDNDGRYNYNGYTRGNKFYIQEDRYINVYMQLKRASDNRKRISSTNPESNVSASAISASFQQPKRELTLNEIDVTHLDTVQLCMYFQKKTSSPAFDFSKIEATLFFSEEFKYNALQSAFLKVYFLKSPKDSIPNFSPYSVDSLLLNLNVKNQTGIHRVLINTTVTQEELDCNKNLDWGEWHEKGILSFLNPTEAGRKLIISNEILVSLERTREKKIKQTINANNWYLFDKYAKNKIVWLLNNVDAVKIVGRRRNYYKILDQFQSEWYRINLPKIILDGSLSHDIEKIEEFNTYKKSISGSLMSASHAIFAPLQRALAVGPISKTSNRQNQRFIAHTQPRKLLQTSILAPPNAENTIINDNNNAVQDDDDRTTTSLSQQAVSSGHPKPSEKSAHTKRMKLLGGWAIFVIGVIIIAVKTIKWYLADEEDIESGEKEVTKTSVEVKDRGKQYSIKGFVTTPNAKSINISGWGFLEWCLLWLFFAILVVGIGYWYLRIQKKN